MLAPIRRDIAKSQPHMNASEGEKGDRHVIRATPAFVSLFTFSSLPILVRVSDYSCN